MSTQIIIGDIPDHKATYLIGVLTGMNIPYTVDPKSPLYFTLREDKKISKNCADFSKDGYRILASGGDEDAVNLHVRINEGGREWKET